MKLIGSLTSPYVRKVRIVLAEKKIDYQFELENVWSPENKVQQINPLGKVPVLLMDDGGAVFDSRVIVEYLDTLTPVGKLLPPNGRPRLEVKCWEALADGVLDAAVLIQLENTQRQEAQRSEKWLDRQRVKISKGLAAMSEGLKEAPFCVGTSLTLADIAVGCALGYLDFRQPAINWRNEHPNLGKLAEKLFQRQSFLDTKPPAI